MQECGDRRTDIPKDRGRNGHSPERRGCDFSLDKSGYGRGQSSSPYRRDRDSPDYVHGSKPNLRLKSRRVQTMAEQKAPPLRDTKVFPQEINEVAHVHLHREKDLVHKTLRGVSSKRRWSLCWFDYVMYHVVYEDSAFLNRQCSILSYRMYQNIY